MATNHHDTTDDSERALYRNFIEQPPQLTDDQVSEMERQFAG
ncbi:MAG: hypothetical protein WA637_26095 [Terriglobales bacterium]